MPICVSTNNCGYQMDTYRRPISIFLLTALSFLSISFGCAHGRELSDVLLKMPQGQCDPDAKELLSAAEQSIAAGGRPTRQSGWTNAHIDLMSTNELLIAEVGREYAAAKCWNDVLRLVNSTDMSDEILVRVSYLLGQSGAFEEAGVLTTFVKKDWALNEILEYLFELAVHQRRMDIAGKISSYFAPQQKDIYSKHALMLQSLSKEGRHDEVKALCEKHWDDLKPADWIWLARAEVETGNRARARSLIRRAIRTAPTEMRDELRLLASGITATYFPSDSLRNFRHTRNDYPRSEIFATTLRNSKTGRLRKALFREALAHPENRYLRKQTVLCAAARFDAAQGHYEKALANLGRNHCSGREKYPGIARAFDLEVVVRQMVRRGDTEQALEWVRRMPDEYAYLFVPPVVWGLAKAGRSEEAMALIEPRKGQVLSHTILPAAATVLPADSPFAAWLDLALRASTPADPQEASLQALSAAFARASGPEAVLNWMGPRLEGFKRARVLVGIAEGKRGVTPGSILPSYWLNFD